MPISPIQVPSPCSKLSPIEKFQRIKKILEDVAENCCTKTEELEDQINKLKQETNRVSMISRAETSSKIITELEARLFESEREKVKFCDDI
jgi:hypothetical protein